MRNPHRVIALAALSLLVGCSGSDDEPEIDEDILELGSGPACDVCDVDATHAGCPDAGDPPDKVSCDGPWEVQQLRSCSGAFAGCGCASWTPTRHASCGIETASTGGQITVPGNRRRFICHNSNLPEGQCTEPDHVWAQNKPAAEAACAAELATRVQAAQARPHFQSWITTSWILDPPTPTGNQFVGWTWTCKLTVDFKVASLCDNAECTALGVCGACLQNNTCNRYDPSCGAATTTFGFVGKSQVEVTPACTPTSPSNCANSFTSRTCVTADNIIDPVAKVTALVQRFGGNLTAARAADPAIDTKLVKKIELAYELHGAQLTAAQRNTVRQIYVDNAAALTCGAHADPSVLGAPGCKDVDWMIQYCARMTGEHVDPGLLWGEATHASGTVAAYCADLLYQIDAHGCTKEDVIDEAFDVQRALLDRIGQSYQAEIVPHCAPEDRSKRRDASEKMYRFVQDWHDRAAAVARADADAPITQSELDDTLVGVVADTWSHVDRGLGLTGDLVGSVAPESPPPVCDPEGPSDVVGMLERTTQRSLEADQDLVRAAMTTLRGLPLLAMLGHVSQSELVRLEAQHGSHDLACLISGCDGPNSTPLQTQVAYLYRLFAHLDHPSDGLAPTGGRPEDLRDVLDDPNRPNSAWRDAFSVVENKQSEIVTTLAALAGGVYTAESLDAIDFADAPRSSHAFLEGLRRAKTRYHAYNATQAFGLAAGSYLRTPVNFERRGEIAAVLGQAVARLTDDVNHFETNVTQQIQFQVGALDNQAAIDRILERRGQLVVEVARLDAKRDAHASAVRGQDISVQIADAWIDVQGILDSGAGPVQYLELEHWPSTGLPLAISGADAPATARPASRDIRDVAVLTNGSPAMITASPGEVIAIEVPPQDQWAPKCVVQNTRILGENTPPQQLVAPLTGPGGYGLTQQGSTYVAESLSYGWSESAGVRGQICVTSGPTAGFGVTAEACAYADVSYHNDARDTEGSETRTSAAFYGGLYLPTTPFRAPVGSLLVVELDAGETSYAHIRDVHLVRSPSTTIVVSGAAAAMGSDFYLVVNDTLAGCTATGTTPDSANRLNVSMTRLWSQQAQARATLDAMGAVLQYMRAQEKDLVQQGQILPSQLAAITNGATALLPAEVRTAATYPPALRQVFDALIVAERARLEHAVALANIEEERGRVLDQLNLLRSDLQAAEASDILLRELPRWSALTLDVDELGAESTDVTALIADYIYPVLSTWYPNLLTALQAHPIAGSALARLENQLPGTSLYDLAEDTRIVAQYIVTALPTANLVGTQGNLQVAVSFRRPGTGTFDPLLGPSGGPLTAYKAADPARANAVWNAIDSGEPVTVTLRPEDLYQDLGGVAQLSCWAGLPVIRDIGIALVDPDNDFLSPNGAGLLDVAVDVDTSAEQMFAGMEGPVTYELLGDHLRHLPSVRFVEADEDPASAGTASAMVPAAWARHHLAPPTGAWQPLGRSPFATFTFDPSAVVHPAPSIITPDDIATATELVVYFNLEYTDLQALQPTPQQPNPPPAHKLTWVQSCVAESAACGDGFDNDNDGDIDCADSQCAATTECAP
jgi:hypothetical protein